jgi:hypothetical protein
MRAQRRCQRDLFQSDEPPPEMQPDQRGKIMTLLQVLLLEAAAERATEGDTTDREAGDDDDRA